LHKLPSHAVPALIIPPKFWLRAWLQRMSTPGE
jgi:hypothetical protein